MVAPVPLVLVAPKAGAAAASKLDALASWQLWLVGVQRPSYCRQSVSCWGGRHGCGEAAALGGPGADGKSEDDGAQRTGQQPGPADRRLEADTTLRHQAVRRCRLAPQAEAAARIAGRAPAIGQRARRARVKPADAFVRSGLHAAAPRQVRGRPAARPRGWVGDVCGHRSTRHYQDCQGCVSGLCGLGAGDAAGHCSGDQWLWLSWCL